MKTKTLLFFTICFTISIFYIINIIKSDTMVWYSESKFLYWWNEIEILNFEISWWVQTWFAIKIYNKENISMTYELWSVDASTTSDSFNSKTCLSENETTSFGQYIWWDKSSKTIPAWASGVRNLTAEFPNYYSWTFNWCITFYPSIVWSNNINTLPRRSNFIDIKVNPVWVWVQIKAYPSNRINQSINNSNSGLIKIYNTNKVLQKTIEVWIASDWFGEFLTDIAPGTYHFVFKWQSHLASYLSWVEFSWWNQTIDFTTWANLYSTQQLNLSQDDWYRYQTAWDLKNINWVYDYMINWNDIAIITTNWFIDSGIAVLDPRNLNWDNAVNASDIAIIWINFEKTDPYYNNTFSR